MALQDFFDQELVLFQTGYFHRRVVDRLAHDCGRTPNIGFEPNLLPLIKSIVQQGFGISTLLASAIRVKAYPNSPLNGYSSASIHRRGRVQTARTVVLDVDSPRNC